jgi:hypothetical protein
MSTSLGLPVIRHFMPHPSRTRGRPFGRSPLRVVRRSIKILPGIRLNFGKRGFIRCFAPHLWPALEAAPPGVRRRQASSSTSIGVRGAHVTFGKTGTRTTVGLPGSGLSYTHLDKPHHEHSVVSAPDPAPESNTPPGKAWRGWLWIALTILAVVAVLARITL